MSDSRVDEPISVVCARTKTLACQLLDTSVRQLLTSICSVLSGWSMAR